MFVNARMLVNVKHYSLARPFSGGVPFGAPLCHFVIGKHSSLLLKSLFMDKLKLIGLNLGRVFCFRCGRASAKISTRSSSKQPNLKLKTQAKPVLGTLPSAFTLPSLYVHK